jgi:heme-degrading monooxygenase HmoA
VSEDEDEVVRTWFGQARYGEARSLIAWLHAEVVPAARRARGCLSAEAFAEADGHEVLLITRWSSYDDEQEWEEGDHASLWSSGVSEWVTTSDALKAIRR